MTTLISLEIRVAHIQPLYHPPFLSLRYKPSDTLMAVSDGVRGNVLM